MIMEKHFNLDKKGWKERLKVNLNAQDRNIIKENNGLGRVDPELRMNNASFISLQNKIRQQSSKKPKKQDEDALEELYNGLKPEVGEDDVYELISFNVSYKDDKPRGILNYRVNGEHKQIRF